MKIYFDNNATTPVDPEVRDAMLPYLGELFGNPSSGHRFGEKAQGAVEQAREQVAALLNCSPSRLIFTSGGSEANNMALLSGLSGRPLKKHIIASEVEHASVLALLSHLAGKGYRIELLPVAADGGLDLEQLVSAINDETALVSLMAANNETGVVWPIDEIGAICREKKVLFHCDAIQMVGKQSLDLARLPVDYLTVSSHKLHGPKGAGVLFAGRSASVTPFVFGAGQENGYRAGTENVPALVGFGKACELAAAKQQSFAAHTAELRDTLEEGLGRQVDDVKVNGKGQPRLPNTLNVSFKNCSAAAIIQELDEKGIAVSAHSACHSGDLDPSHVLSAMKIDETYLHGTLRISLSRMNTLDEVTKVLDILPGLVEKSRRGFAV